MTDLKETIVRKSRHRTNLDRSRDGEKATQAAEISDHTAEFLAGGGEIKHIPLGEGADKKVTMRQHQAHVTAVAIKARKRKEKRQHDKGKK